MKSRTPLTASLLANLALAVVVGFCWLKRPALPAPREPAVTLPASLPEPASVETTPALPAALPASTQPAWAQIESQDYRAYIANLRAAGCPERLIRDLIVADLEEYYDSRRASAKRARLPAWAGGDRCSRAEKEHRQAIHALKEEQRAVTEELLGFPYNVEGLRGANEEEFVAILLGHLSADQTVKVLCLSEDVQARARHIRESAGDILLAEDKAALAALADAFEARVASVATPALWEEVVLRLHAVFALGGELHMDAADLTPAQAREVARLASLSKDIIRSELIRLRDDSDDDEKRREAELMVAVAKALGPEKAADLERARDGRFRETLEFTRERQLPRQVAVKAYEIRAAAEEQAQELQADAQLDPASRQAQLAELQASTTAALAQALGRSHLATFLEHSNGWLQNIGGSAPQVTEGAE